LASFHRIFWVCRIAKRTEAGNRALCYTRVSTVEQSKFGFSLDAQEERLRAYCQMVGLEVVELIREEGVSGSISLAKRPAGAKLLQLMDGGIGHVVCLNLDRLFAASASPRQWRGEATAKSEFSDDGAVAFCAGRRETVGDGCEVSSLPEFRVARLTPSPGNFAVEVYNSTRMNTSSISPNRSEAEPSLFSSVPSEDSP
jgi:hypothetical protein